MKYACSPASAQTIAAGATAIVAAFDASANAVIALPHFSIGGDSGTGTDKPLTVEIARNTGGVTGGGASITPRSVEEPNHTAAPRFTVLSGSTTITLPTPGTEEVQRTVYVSPHGSTPFGVPILANVIKAIPGELVLVRVTNPVGNGSVDIRWDADVND